MKRFSEGQPAEPGSYDVEGGINGDVIQLSAYKGNAEYTFTNNTDSDFIIKSNGEYFVTEGHAGGPTEITLVSKSTLKLTEKENVIFVEVL
jgi:hypothetical protein